MLRNLQCRMYATEAAAVRWFRAIDEPISKPKKYNYQPAKPPSKFEAFAASDSARLERAFQKGRSREIVETDGLLTVHFGQNLCSPTYYDGPAYAVRRALWFEQQGAKLGLANEALETALEQKFRENPPAKRFSLNVPQKGHSKGKSQHLHGIFRSTDDSVRATIEGADGWLSLFSKREYVRGLTPTYAAVDAVQSSQSVRPAYEPREVDHLIFCIHGIGQLLSLRYEQVNFVKDVDQFRRELKKAHAKTQHSSNGIQVLPVMWRHNLDDTINGLHPQQLFGSVNVAADVVLDFVMYLQEQHRRDILRVAAAEMRRMYREFCDLNPGFAANPKVSIVGHSLGSVIAHDIVSRSDEELPFEVTNLFTMGSPAGILELMQRSPTIDKGKALNMYNILRRADPVAARLEPIVDKAALDVPPQPLAGGGTNLLKQLKTFTEEISAHSEVLSTKAAAIWNTMTTSESTEAKNEREVKPSPHVDLAALKQYNRHGRLDFSVTETMDISLLLGLAGHLMYLDNEDIASFVLKETLNL